MAYIDQPTIVSYIVSGGDTFPFGFKWFEQADINVFYVPLGEDADDTAHHLPASSYTITSNASLVGGEVKITIPMIDGSRVTISRVLPFVRNVDYATRGSFTAVGVNEDQDYQSYLLADLAAYSEYYMRGSVSGGGGTTLVFPAPLADAFFKWDSSGTKIVNDTEPPIWRDETLAARDQAEAYKDEAGVSAAAALLSETHAASSEQGAILKAWDAEAEALTASSLATEPEDVEVNHVTSDGDGSFTYTPVADTYSALHWSIKSSKNSAGTLYQGTWDASTGVYPTVRPTGGALRSGDLFIVDVAGTISSVDWGVGDWMIRNVTNDGWDRVAYKYVWGAIDGVPENVSNALSRSGGTMTGQIKGITPMDDADLVRKDYADGLIERGGDNLSAYTKFPDGTLICYGTDTTDMTTSETHNGINYSITRSVQYVHGFIEEPSITASAYKSSGVGVFWASTTIQNDSLNKANLVVFSSSSTGSGRLKWQAIGRWK